MLIDGDTNLVEFVRKVAIAIANNSDILPTSDPNFIAINSIENLCDSFMSFRRILRASESSCSNATNSH